MTLRKQLLMNWERNGVDNCVQFNKEIQQTNNYMNKNKKGPSKPMEGPF